MNQCNWNKAWIGRCKTDAAVDDYCPEHTKLCAVCGEAATHDCETTLGPLVCGTLLCGSCACPRDAAWSARFRQKTE